MTRLQNIGRVAVSIVVSVGFFIVLYLFLTKAQGNTSDNVSMMLGALTTSFTAVVSYWIGSSAGSGGKDDAVRELSAKLAAVTAQNEKLLADKAGGGV